MKRLNLSQPTPAKHARLPGRKEQLIGANGEVNASNKEDLLKSLVTLAKEVSASNVSLEDDVSEAELIQNRKQKLEAAFATDEGSREWSELGSAVAADINETADRDGVMRRFLLRTPVSNGEVPRIRFKQKNVTAIVGASAAHNRPQYIEDRYFWPPEWYIDVNILVDKREMVQGSSDILNEKFYEGLEGIMVKEDRKMKAMFDDTVGVSNDLQILAGGLTPAGLQQMKTQLMSWNLPAEKLFFAMDIMDDLVGQPVFHNFFDPVSQLEIIQTGQLGNLLGMSIYTDAFREPSLRVLKQGEIYITSTPDMLGFFTDRGPVESKETDGKETGTPARGWYMNELLAMGVANSRAVVKGVRA